MNETQRPKVAYLVTSSLSSLLVRGQLDFVASRGFDVVVGTGIDHSRDTTFDESADVVDLGFRREIAPLSDAISFAKTLRFLWRERPDIVNASTPKAALLGGLAAWLLRIPGRVYVVRGLRYETASGPGRKALMAIEGWLMGASTDVILNSQSLLERVVRDELADESICRVLAGGSGNGIDTTWLSPLTVASARQQVDLPKDSFVIGFVGRLTRDKGIVDLADVFESLMARHPSLRLLLVGDFEEGDAVPEATRRFLQDSERVTHLGWVQDPSTAYAAMDVFMFPSYREGLPNAVLEAQLAGLPVVGYAATGTVDAVLQGQTATLVPVGRTGQLEGALAQLIENPQLARQMGSAGRSFVERNFDRVQVWEDVVRVYRHRLRNS